MAKCQRCGKETYARTMYMINTDEICMECKEAEKLNPLYKKAVEAEREACKRGDYNFRGIGY